MRNNTVYLTFVTLTLLSLTSAPVVAEASTTCTSPNARGIQQDDSARAARLAGASADSAGGQDSVVTIIATTGDVDAVVKLAKSCAWYERPAQDTGSGVGITDTKSLTLKAPVAKGGRPTELASLAGFDTGTNLEFRWTQARTRGLRLHDDGRAKSTFCADFARDFESQKDKFPDIKKWECTLNNVRTVFKDDPRVANFTELFVDPSRLGTMTLSVAGGIGVTDFSYFHPQTLAAEESRSTSPSASALWGYHVPATKQFYSLEAKFTKTYKDAKEGTRCPAPNGSAPLICASGPMGAPVLTTSHLLTGEVRQQFSDTNKAMGIKLRRDFKRKLSAVEIPYYVLSDGTGGLTGGISLGWTSADKRANISFFIGQPFSLF